MTGLRRPNPRRPREAGKKQAGYPRGERSLGPLFTGLCHLSSARAVRLSTGMTVLRRSARTLIGATICLVVGVAFAVIFLVGLAVTVQFVVWWLT